MAAKPFNVLVTGAGSTTAVTALKGLRAMNDPSVQVLMGDVQPDCAGAYLGDVFVRLPAARDPCFEAVVLELCRARRVDLVIPIIDDEFAAWSRLAGGLLAAGTRVAISASDVIATCEQKDMTDRYFRQIGVPSPPIWRIADIEDPSALPFPVILKPRCGRGSVDANRADDLAAYVHYAARREDLLAQPFLEGDEVTIDTLSDFDGRFLGASPRRRLEVKSGQAYRSLTLHAPELVAYAKRIVEGLPIIGPANIQCFLTADGPRFIEINARFGAGTALSMHAGFNAAAALVTLARGGAVAEQAARPGVLMLRYWQEVFVARTGGPIFLDLDGPLLDVSRRHYQVYHDILEAAGKPVLSFEAYWRAKCARRPHDAIVAETAGDGFYETTFRPAWLARVEAEEYLALDRVWPWAIDALAELYRDHELYLVTVRSRPPALARQLDRLDLRRWFRAILCRPARERAAEHKIAAIREELGAVPRHAIMVGDTEADIECGRVLGFLTVGVLGGIRGEAELRATRCDYLLESIASLPDLVARLGRETPRKGADG